MVEQVEEESEAETESHRERATGRIRGTTAEQIAPATEVEMGIQISVVEPEQQRTEEELRG